MVVKSHQGRVIKHKERGQIQEAVERWRSRFTQNFEGDRKMFLKEVKRVRKDNTGGRGAMLILQLVNLATDQFGNINKCST